MRSASISFIAISSAALMACATNPTPTRTVNASPLRPASNETVTLDHLLVLVDSSGSVDDTTMFANERELVRAYTASVPDGRYEAGTVAFGGANRQTLPLAQFDRNRLRGNAEEIRHLKQGTPIYKVLEESKDTLGTRSGRGAVVIFSDGLVTDEFGRLTEPGRTAAAAKELAAAYSGELCFHTVQVGKSPQGAEELRSIADATRCGSYRAADATSSEGQLHAFHRQVFLGQAQALPPVAAPVARPAPQPAPTPVAAPAPERLVGPWKINFASDSSDIESRYHSRIDEVAAELKADPSARLRLVGHTDTTGNAAYNEALSVRRSKVTRDALIQRGVDASRIEALGEGQGKPVAPNDTDQNRRANRRTDIYLVK